METPETKSSLPEEFMRRAGQDATLARMLEMKRPLTVETYLAMNYPDGAPPMTAELWEEIPEMLREDQSDFPPPATEQNGIKAEPLRKGQVRKMVKDSVSRSQGVPVVTLKPVSKPRKK